MGFNLFRCFFPNTTQSIIPSATAAPPARVEATVLPMSPQAPPVAATQIRKVLEMGGTSFTVNLSGTATFRDLQEVIFSQTKQIGPISKKTKGGEVFEEPLGPETQISDLNEFDLFMTPEDIGLSKGEMIALNEVHELFPIYDFYKQIGSDAVSKDPLIIKFKERLDSPQNTHTLDLNGTNITKVQLAAFIAYIKNNYPDVLKNLEELRLSGCKSLETLPDSLGELTSLKILNLSYCNSLTTLPNSLEELKELENLNLSYCKSLTAELLMLDPKGIIRYSKIQPMSESGK